MSATRQDRLIVVWLGLAACAWSMLFVWQGLDFLDMGFWLTSYQQFYSHPDVIQASCWLSCFIGHWTGAVLGGGVIAYKLGYVAVVTASALISYLLLASQLGRSRTLAAMVLLTVFFTRGYAGNWIGYNELTALFYLAGAALLFRGLVGRRRLLVALAGVVLGANILVRFPNLLGIGLVAAIWLHAWARRWTLREAFAWSGWFLGGVLVGVALVWGVIILHGHQAIYVQSIRAVFGLAVASGSHHPASGLLKTFISDHCRAFGMALPLVVLGGGIATWASKQSLRLASVIVLAGAWLVYHELYRCEYWPWIVPGLCYVALIATVIREWRNNRDIALLAFIAGMVLLLAPLGSNNGIFNAVYGMWLALPLTLTWLWQNSGRGFRLRLNGDYNGIEFHGQYSMEARGIRVFAKTIALALLFQSLAAALHHTYMDSKKRFTMTHSITHPLLVGTYTTAARARVVTELLDAMSRFTKPGDEVLAYNAIPAVFYLTGTHPWLGISWPDFESSANIARVIGQKEQAGAALPTIVRATRSTYANSWPNTTDPLATWWQQDDSRRAFADFEQSHGYALVWSNDFFEILTTTR